MWGLSNISLVHVVRCITSFKFDIHDYIENYLMTSAFSSAYSNIILYGSNEDGPNLLPSTHVSNPLEYKCLY